VSGGETAGSPIGDAISLALNPSLWGGVFVAFLAFRFEPTGGARWLAASLGFVFVALVPVGLLFALKAAGHLSDVEMRDQGERGAVYLACAASYTVGAIALYWLDATWPVWGLVGLHAPYALVLAALNRRWKVSIHTTGLAGLAAAGWVLFGAAALPLVVIPVIGGWGRWAARAHSLAELTWGAAIGFVLTGGGLLGLRILQEGLK